MNLFRTLQSSKNGGSAPPDLLVFSHLRWHFVTQRPQHLLTRAAKDRTVYFWEEPYAYDDTNVPSDLPAEGRLEFLEAEGSPNLTVVRPHLRAGENAVAVERALLDRFLAERSITRFDAWFYTPMALGFAAHLKPEVTIYDAMDELSAFAGAPPQLLERERELFRRAHVVFTGAAVRCTSTSVRSTTTSMHFPVRSKRRTLPRHCNRSRTPPTRHPFPIRGWAFMAFWMSVSISL